MRLAMSFLFLTCWGVLSTCADTPLIENITLQQRWPWSRKVNIEFTLDCADNAFYDIELRAYNRSQELVLPRESLSGDLFKVGKGKKLIVWDPTLTEYAKVGVLPQLSVELTPVKIPLYMVIDLTKSPGADGQIKYIYEGELTNEVYGSFERDPISNLGEPIKSVVWTAVTNGTEYKCEKMVLRRIPAGTFNMGPSGNIPTTLTKPYYIGVFPVTQRQWELIYNDKPSYYSNVMDYATRPVEYITYTVFRGAASDAPPVEWPETGNYVSPGSFLGVLRSKIGLDSFDLPTEAQWEYACRAGTTTDYFTGENIAAGAATTSNAQLNAMGRYMYNGGQIVGSSGSYANPSRDVDANWATAKVGSYLYNAWGLYDLAGNVTERCRTWNGTLQGGNDPPGPATSLATTHRNVRGGSMSLSGNYMPSGYRGALTKPTEKSVSGGVRVVLEL